MPNFLEEVAVPQPSRETAVQEDCRAGRGSKVGTITCGTWNRRSAFALPAFYKRLGVSRNRLGARSSGVEL